jgi:hypothetical protein
MLTNVISSFAPINATVPKLISWKHSFKRLNEEYEIAKKKKQALDNLYETGRISQSTRDSFNNEILAAITEIEKQQQDLLAKMQLKTQELESQIKTLETLFANYEIQHVVGEIDEEIYQREINLLGTGLETAKHELNTIKEAANQLCPPTAMPTPEPAPAPITEPAATEPAPTPITEPTTPEPAPEVVAEPVPTPVAETAPPPAENETAPNPPPETAPEAPAEVEVTTEPATVEPVVTIAEPITEQPPAENTEALPAETPQPVEEAPKEANPQKAPSEAQQEIIVEPITEQAQCAEETAPAAETTAENVENQEKS